MRILMASSELLPLAKVGGLADMVSSLSEALRGLGHDVRCALPRYASVEERLPPGSRRTEAAEVRIELEGRATTAHLSLHEEEGLPSPVLLVGHPLFDRPGIYDDPATRLGFPDNGLRWAVFCRALHAWLGTGRWVPDVVHGHDHQAALLAALLRWREDRVRKGGKPATVFTIHNLGYQGVEPRSWIAESALPEGLDYAGGPLEYHGEVNLMKIGIEAADRLTTVSPRYAVEIRSGPEFGAGLEGVLASASAKLSGILNGIDTRAWDPSLDPHLPFRYALASLGDKARNRAALRKELGLARPERPAPLVGMVTRLVAQKGIDLLLPALDAVLADGIQLAVLGSGEDRFERAIEEAAKRHPGRLAFSRGHDEGLAHRIEAGADMFLMPSRYEPCGLNQMYSLRYGTVPVVRAVGGLADTVFDPDEDRERANGFVFRAYEPVELLKTLRRAARAWKDRKGWRRLQRRGMETDFSWKRSAGRYVEVYGEALAERT